MSYLTPVDQQKGLRDSLKASVRVASTGNLNLGGSHTVLDTVALNDGDRALIKDQTLPSENGLYTWSGTTNLFSRARDSLVLFDGLLVTVGEGASHADTLWKLATNNPITVGVTGLVFQEQTSGGTLATTLLLGNTTGGSDLILTSGDLLTTLAGIDLTIQAADNALGTGGGLNLLAGSATGTGDSGGAITIRAGDGGPTGSDGGAVLLYGGDGNVEVGGSVEILGGTGDGGFVGGMASIRGGTGGPLDGTGANARIAGGTGGVTNGDGGNVLLVPGPGTGTGVDGLIDVQGLLKVTGPGLVLTESATPPSTGVAESALFVSDGTGGLVENQVYIVPESNGTPVLVSGGFSALTLGVNETVDGVTAQKGVCQFAFDPNEWGLSRNFYFEVVLSVDDVTRTGQAWLYNLTDLETVTGTTLGTSNLSPTKYRSAALTVGSAAGNLQDSEKLYEVRINNDGTLVTENTFLGVSLVIIDG